MNKRLKILLGILAGIALAGLIIWHYQGQNAPVSQTTSEISKKPNKQEEVKKTVCLVDGSLVDENLANRHPLAIMIENSVAARPQIGLADAQLVYEAIAEGGITRFLAIYSCSEPEKVGPVRSARIYYLDWVSEFNAFYAHVGGNYDALQKIKEYGILDLDQFRYGNSAYWRVPEAGKAIEHTMYTSTKKLWNIADKNKWPKKADFTPWDFKDDLEESQRPQNASATVNFSTPNYSVKWSYDPKTNTYSRSQTKTPTIKAKNIIIQWMDRWPIVSKIGERGYAMKTVGSGKAKILMDGKVIDGTWKKDSRTERTWFYDSSGNKIKFNRGQIWIEIVHNDTPIKLE